MTREAHLRLSIRTSNSFAAVCESSPGTYYYRGERLRDGANLQLSNAAPSGSGYAATNPADGARYEVQPGMLTISSRVAWIPRSPRWSMGRGRGPACARNVHSFGPLSRQLVDSVAYVDFELDGEQRAWVADVRKFLTST